MGSTELLLRSRDQHRTLPGLPAALGAGYSGNGDLLAFGYDTDAAIEPAQGPTITTALVVDTEAAGGREWFLVEEGGYSQQLARLVRDLDLGQLPPEALRALSRGALELVGRTRAQAGDLTGRTGHTAVLLVMGRDRADGRIELHGPRHRLHVRWDTTGNLPLYAAEQAAAAQLAEALGGRLVATPTWRMFRQPVSVHNLGGCRMADDPAAGVVDGCCAGQGRAQPGAGCLAGDEHPAGRDRAASCAVRHRRARRHPAPSAGRLAHQLAGMRATRTAGPLSATTTVGRFLIFFASELVRAITWTRTAAPDSRKWPRPGRR